MQYAREFAMRSFPALASLRLFAAFVWLFSWLAAARAGVPSTNFVNFETAPVHPIALSPNGQLVAVCNLPDGRVELLNAADLAPVDSIAVGIDPVTARFRSDAELWVVNHISDSINIIDVPNRRVSSVISTRDGPADVVFAGTPLRAFVSCPPENVVQVFDPETAALVQAIPVAAERPKAMTVSQDGSRVYVAILESGNGTTILAPRMTELTQFSAANPVDLFGGPHSGLNPPPNVGTNLEPAIGTNLPASIPPPRVALIVKKQADGRWLDDNGGNWTEFVSGTNAPHTGRVRGWELTDHDVAVIDASNFAVSFLDRLMNICFDLAVNPADGTLAVVGTDAINHVRYEPMLRGIFTRAKLAFVGASKAPAVLDLNPHLNYEKRVISAEERKRTVGDPRAALWHPNGQLLYVAAMGSDNVAVYDANGRRIAQAEAPGGPSGLAFDNARNRLLVFCRFDSKVAALDPLSLKTLLTAPLFDPTPAAIKAGRPHFYNTHKSSGLGQASCASCHVDGRFDRLAWDLGTPVGEMVRMTTNHFHFGAFPPVVTNDFHPMKGPMVTQTLQDIVGHEPFHWRGDRKGLEEFNATFLDLQAADRKLSDTEMQEFEDFLATLAFPPNRFRTFDNALPRNLALPGQLALGRGQRDKGAQLPNGDALAGLNFFRSSSCRQCHSLPTGMGAQKVFRNGRWTSIPLGPSGEHQAALSAVERSDELPFKIPHLRNLPEKIGLSFGSPAQAGFGFFHDGRVDTLTRFLQDGFALTDDKQTADLIAFLLAFSGSDLPVSAVATDRNAPPGAPSRDAPAAAGRQLLLQEFSVQLNSWTSRANSSTGRLDLVARTALDGQARGWFYNRATRLFLPDRQSAAAVSPLGIFTNREPGTPVLFTLVPAGTGRRLGIDRDLDGSLDFDEKQAGSDPANPASVPPPPSGIVARIENLRGEWVLIHSAEPGRTYRILRKGSLSDPAWAESPPHAAASRFVTNSLPLGIADRQRFFIIEVQP